MADHDEKTDGWGKARVIATIAETIARLLDLMARR